MALLSRRTAFIVGNTLVMLTASCSSSSNDTGTPGPSATEGGSTTPDGGSGTTGSAVGCPTSVIGILFSPMYSAYDGTHTFKIPAIVDNIAASAITWGSADPSMVDLATDTTTGGVMITTRKAGTVSIIAQAGTICGSSLLTITAATAEQWEIGSQRYNNGTVVLPGRNGGIQRNDASAEAKCTNCHGDLANGPYKTVAHTPQQTGGFSDADLQNIFRHGNVPDGGYFDEMIVSYNTWHGFHQWDMTDEESIGIIAYLRSLTPQAQMGSFGGRGPTDGGGGFQRNDGGNNMMRNDGGAPRGRPDAAGDALPPSTATDALPPSGPDAAVIDDAAVSPATPVDASAE